MIVLFTKWWWWKSSFVNKAKYFVTFTTNGDYKNRRNETWMLLKKLERREKKIARNKYEEKKNELYLYASSII